MMNDANKLLGSWKEVRKSQISFISFYIILFICLCAIFATWISPFNYDQQNISQILKSPNKIYWFGTDQLGRDVLSRVLFGARVSILVGVVSAFFSLIIGLIYGSVSGWFGGWVDFLMMRIVDTIHSLPTLIIMILIKVIVDGFEIIANPEVRALCGTIIALSIVGWVSMARIVRGQVLQIKHDSFIEAGKALGFNRFRILYKHILPNIIGPIIVILTYRIPANILYESFLSYIGLGLQPPFSSWGVLVSDGSHMLESYPHLIFFPGLVLFITMVAFQLFGDSLRDVLDPKLKMDRFLR
jgi:oligopeptide transport system permease protein